MSMKNDLSLSQIFGNKIPLGLLKKNKNVRYYVAWNSEEVFIAKEPITSTKALIGMFVLIIFAPVLTNWLITLNPIFKKETSVLINLMIIVCIVILMGVCLYFNGYIIKKPYSFFMRNISFTKVEVDKEQLGKILNQGVFMFNFTKTLLYVVGVSFGISTLYFIGTSDLVSLAITFLLGIIILLLAPFLKDIEANREQVQKKLITIHKQLQVDRDGD